jgi:hypothetical protein
MTEVFTNFWFLLFGMITITTVAGAVATAWCRVQQATIDAELKRDMLQRGMSCEEIERVLAASAQPKNRPWSAGAEGISVESLNEVVSVLGQVMAPPAVIEEVLSAFRSADSHTQELISEAIQNLVGSATHKVTGEQILAVVRPLCQPRAAANAQVVSIRDERIRREVQ